MTQPGVASAGAVALDVEPDAQEFYPRLRAQILPAADAVGRDIGRRISAPIVSEIARGVAEGVRDGGRGVGAQGTRIGNDLGAAIGRALKARVEAAVRSMPDVKINADTSALDRKIEASRAKMTALSGASVRVDVDTGGAEAKLAAIEAAAGRVGALRPSVLIDVDAARAQAVLSAVEAQVNALSGNDVKIKVSVSTGSGAARLDAIAAAAAALSSTTIDITVNVHSTGALAQLALVATAVRDLGAMTPVITPRVNIAGALASLAALRGAASGSAGAGGLGLLLAVGVSLAPAIVPAIAAIVAALGAIGPAAAAGAFGLGVLALGFSGVPGAIQKITASQNKASASGAKLAQQHTNTAAAARALVAAQRGLANAEANAAEQRRQSADKIRTSEQELASAQTAARIAQEGLTAARKAAKEAQEDLASSVAGGALAQRAALLDVTEAQRSLDDTMTNPQSTNLERQRAQLNYDQAKQNLADLVVRNRRLNEQQIDANKKGIEGSAQVQGARQKIADADKDVAAKQKALTDARHDSDVQARQSAFSIAQAQDGVIGAQEALKQSYQKTGVAGVTAANAAASAFKGHSKEFKDFVLYILGVKDAFLQVRNAAEAGLLPGVEDGIKAIVPALPAIAKVVYQVALAMGDLFRSAGKALASPFWLNFFRMIGNFAGPAFKTFGTIMGGLSKGFASLIIAFMPFSQTVGDGLASMATSFATWAASLAKSDGFKAFIAYVSENGPVLVKLLGDIVLTAIKLGIVFAPLGEIILKGLGKLFDFLANADPSVLAIIAATVGVLIIAIGGLEAPVIAIVAAITLIVGALVYAWTHFAIFRDTVMTIVTAVGAAAVWLWQKALKPAFEAIAGFVMGTLMPAFLIIWHQVIKPIFTAIGVIARIMWAILKPIFQGLWFIIAKVVAPIIVWLFKAIVEPIFKSIWLAIQIAWAIIKVVFGLLSLAIKGLGALFTWLYDHAIKPAWDWIKTKILGVWNDHLKPLFDKMSTWVEKNIAPGFEAGVRAIGKAWDKIKEIAKIPIKFVVNTLLNNGLLAGYNKIAKMFNVKPDNVQIPLPPGFATGGPVRGMGNGTSDSILARLSNGEYVIPANIVRMFGVGFFDFLLGKAPKGGNAVHPGDGSEGLAFAAGGAVPAFADGGFVGAIEGLWGKVSDPLGWVKDKVMGLVAKIPGAGAVVDMLKGFGTKAIGWAVSWLREHLLGKTSGDGKYTGPIDGNTATVQQFIRAQEGKPYIWASTGPAGYDCSGALSAVYNLMHGKQPYSRVFSTSNEQGFFPKPGHGLFTAGMAHGGQRGAGPTIGHTAGNLAGLAFESRGGDGFVVGNRATSVDSFAYTGTYDSGGWLLPGLTVAHNGTGVPERILTGSQWSNVERALAGAGAGGSRPNVTYQVTPKYATVDAGAMRAIVAEQDLRERVGRPE